MGDGKVLPVYGKFFASATGRTQYWNGIQQDISGRVQRKLAYSMTAYVRIFGNNVTSATIRATLWVQTPDSREQYIGIGKLVSSILADNLSFPPTSPYLFLKEILKALLFHGKIAKGNDFRKSFA